MTFIIYLTALVICLMAALSIADFTSLPSSVTVGVSEKALFQCRYPGASIVWRINGQPVVTSQSVNVTSGDQPSDTLTITAELAFNGSEVVCVALLSDLSTRQTPPVYLIIILILCTHALPPVTSSPSVTPPTTSISPRSGFLVTPLSQNVTIGTTVSFHCEHETGSVFWLINGTRSEDFPAATAINIGGAHILTITEPSLEYSGTKIECVAILDSEQKVSPPATLLLQGQLDVVTNISRDSSTISWKTPPSLDLTNVEPDIVYCVDVYNLTCGGRELLISDCDVTETSYTSDVIARYGYIYEYIVTPRSNVEGAINGTPSQPVRDQFPPLTQQSSQVSVINTTTVTYKVLFTLNVTEHNLSIPSSFTLSLNSLDGLSDMDSVDTVTRRIGAVLTLDVPTGLPRQRLWNLIIKPYECQNGKLSVLGDAELSTHDIQNISVTSPQPGEVRVTGDFIDGSTATGLLVIIYSANITEYQIVQGRLNLEAVISGQLEGDYEVSVFVVEENGLPFGRAASKPKQFTISSAGFIAENRNKIKYKLLLNSTGVTIVCTFLDANSLTSTKTCIVVVHQRVDQLNSSGLINIDSYIFTRDGDTATGFIEGLNLKEYQIGVIGGIRKVPSESNAGLSICSRASFVCVTSITISVVAGFVLIVIVVITCTVLGKRNRTHNDNTSTGQESSVAGVQMKRCEAYEVTTLARKKITMEPNLAYEQVCIV